MTALPDSDHLRALLAKANAKPPVSAPHHAFVQWKDDIAAARDEIVNALGPHLDAMEAKDAEIARLREALRPFAARRTISEILANPETPAWADAPPEDRIRMMGERKRENDAAIIAARTALNEEAAA